MQTMRSIALAERAEEECRRDTFPPGFPEPIDVAAARYTDADFLALEREHVLEKSWLFVAHGDQLPKPGDFLMLDALEKLGHPIFLVRGRDGVIRAFYNSCRHRGGPLVDQPSGSTGRALLCKYHVSFQLRADVRLFHTSRALPCRKDPELFFDPPAARSRPAGRGPSTTCPPATTTSSCTRPTRRDG